MYYLKKDFDIEDLTLQKEEVDSVEWNSIDKIKQLIGNGLFIESYARAFYRLIDIFKKRGVNLEDRNSNRHT